MILLDTSALIEYYRPSGDAAVRSTVAEAIAADLAAVNGIIQVEMLAFASGEEERRLLEDDFEAFHHLDLSRKQFDRACELGFALRRRGVTVPATDLIIAASAILSQAEILHVDGHFDRIAEISDLRSRHLGRAPSTSDDSTLPLDT
ncbi:MAG TPA: PIN domain-containing protein [Thermoanaerobaculia bacterium]|nr:PIN domain-containing protein [Thermoanaerobaculia bacterium]